MDTQTHYLHCLLRFKFQLSFLFVLFFLSVLQSCLIGSTLTVLGDVTDVPYCPFTADVMSFHEVSVAFSGRMP